MDNPPPVDAAGRMEIIRELCSFEGRLTGTDAERRAANRLAERLRELGRRVEIEPTYVHPQWALVHAVHCLLALRRQPRRDLAPRRRASRSCSLAATSMYLDLNYRLYLLRSLFFRRGSQNVVSPGPNPGARARARDLRPHRRRPQRRRLRPAPRPARSPDSPSARRCRSAPSGSSSGRWRCCCRCSARAWRASTRTRSRCSSSSPRSSCWSASSRWSRSSSPRSSRAPTTTPPASPPRSRSPAELDADPPAQPRRLGRARRRRGVPAGGDARASSARHRKELDRERTFFLAIDSVGGGDVRFETSAGWVVSYAMDRRLIELCTAIAEADAEGESATAPPLASGIGRRLDAAAARAACARSGSPAATPTATVAEPPPADRHARTRSTPPRSSARTRFALELVRRLDADLGRAAPDR